MRFLNNYTVLQNKSKLSVLDMRHVFFNVLLNAKDESEVRIWGHNAKKKQINDKIFDLVILNSS